MIKPRPDFMGLGPNDLLALDYIDQPGIDATQMRLRVNLEVRREVGNELPEEQRRHVIERMAEELVARLEPLFQGKLASLNREVAMLETQLCDANQTISALNRAMIALTKGAGE